jgi:hypothetical protein
LSPTVTYFPLSVAFNQQFLEEIVLVLTMRSLSWTVTNEAVSLMRLSVVIRCRWPLISHCLSPFSSIMLF